MRDDLREIRINTIRIADNARGAGLDVTDLVESIRQKGLLQPILVRRCALEGYQYELIAGHRRLAACREIGLERIPALIHDIHTDERLVLQLIENVQRSDLSPYEIAVAIRRLIEADDSSQQAAAHRLGKSYTWAWSHLTYAELYEDLRDRGIDRVLLERIPVWTLLEFRGLTPEQQDELVAKVAGDDARVLSQDAVKQIVQKVYGGRKKKNPGGAGPWGDGPNGFTIAVEQDALTLHFTKRLELRRILNLLLEQGGTRT